MDSDPLIPKNEGNFSPKFNRKRNFDVDSALAVNGGLFIGCIASLVFTVALYLSGNNTADFMCRLTLCLLAFCLFFIGCIYSHEDGKGSIQAHYAEMTLENFMKLSSECKEDIKCFCRFVASPLILACFSLFVIAVAIIFSIEIIL